jgi:hypothetical protein
MIGVGTYIDDALVEVAALGLYRIAIRRLLRGNLGSGIAVRFDRRGLRLNFRRAVWAIAL